MDQDYVSTEKRRLLERTIPPLETKPYKKLVEASSDQKVDSNKTVEDSPAPGEESAP